ncbi:hypothetical protein F511_27728 [Dorcoceras hygrometricum]|uniref:Uncharacterized protein n=1 Tax=Dorcoceras hygrometricum TaxID=472368 RepID=A0A2Z7DAS0_9LAMI|nr:hypothetical protein F511_27728 [Dorcoceras hygrometricum]
MSSSLIQISLTSTSACATADLSSSTDYDDVTDYIIIDGPLRCSSWFPFDVTAASLQIHFPSAGALCNQRLLQQHYSHFQPAVFIFNGVAFDYKSSVQIQSLPAGCDDITTDVIIADPDFSLLQRLLAQQLIFLHLMIMMTSPITSSSMVHLDVPAGSLLMFQLVHLPSLALAADSYRFSWFTMLQLLPAGCDDITSDVIIADPAFSLLQRLLAQQLIFLHLLIMMMSPITSSSMVHLDVPDGSLLMFQLVHLPSLALAAGSYRSSWFTMLQLVQLGLSLITNN